MFFLGYAEHLTLPLQRLSLESSLNMKIVEIIDVLSVGTFSNSNTWKTACTQVNKSIAKVDWPHGSGQFTIRPLKHGNGVKPIKIPCLRALQKLGWEIEKLPPSDPLTNVLNSGDLDALLFTERGYIGFEWETGNISSSHRAINKLLLTLFQGAIKAGIIVVPSAKIYRFLTDRVGNITELRPYLPLWRALPTSEGCLRIIVVEHDFENPRVRKIPKGTDGRAMR